MEVQTPVLCINQPNNRLFLCPLKNSLAAPVPPQQREGVCKARVENTDAESCSTRSLPTLLQQSGQQALGSVCGGVSEGTALPVRYKNTRCTPMYFGDQHRVWGHTSGKAFEPLGGCHRVRRGLRGDGPSPRVLGVNFARDNLPKRLSEGWPALPGARELHLTACSTSSAFPFSFCPLGFIPHTSRFYTFTSHLPI